MHSSEVWSCRHRWSGVNWGSSEPEEVNSLTSLGFNRLHQFLFFFPIHHICSVAVAFLYVVHFCPQAGREGAGLGWVRGRSECYHQSVNPLLFVFAKSHSQVSQSAWKNQKKISSIINFSSRKKIYFRLKFRQLLSHKCCLSCIQQSRCSLPYQHDL